MEFSQTLPFALEETHCVFFPCPKPTVVNYEHIRRNYPNAKDELFALSQDGSWKAIWLEPSTEFVIERWVIIPLISEGVDLGQTYDMTFHPASFKTDNPPITKAAVERAVKNLGKKMKLPSVHWYEVKVTNPSNGKSALWIMLVDPGATRSAVPLAYTRIGVEAAGCQNTTTHTGSIQVKCGVVQMQLMRRAFDDGLDSYGDKKWRFEDLPKELQETSKKNVEVFAKLEGEVAHIGLNELLEWGVKVDPSLGLVP